MHFYVLHDSYLSKLRLLWFHKMYKTNEAPLISGTEQRMISPTQGIILLNYQYRTASFSQAACYLLHNASARGGNSKNKRKLPAPNVHNNFYLGRDIIKMFSEQCTVYGWPALSSVANIKPLASRHGLIKIPNLHSNRKVLILFELMIVLHDK